MTVSRKKTISVLLVVLMMISIFFPSVRSFAQEEYTTNNPDIELQASRDGNSIRTELVSKNNSLNFGGLGFFYSFDNKVNLDNFDEDKNVNSEVFNSGKAWNALIHKAGITGSRTAAPAGTTLVYFTHTLKNDFEYDTEYEFAVNMDMAYEGTAGLPDYGWHKAIFKVTYAEYTVEFTAPDADTPVSETQYIVRGEKADAPADPQRKGYTFRGWEAQGGSETPVTGAIEEPVIFAATWEANPADVTINPDGGTITPNSDVDKDGKIADGKKVGDTIEVPEIEKPGYTLKNWEDEEGNSLQPGNEYTVPTGKGTLTPVWEVVTYEITYDLDGGTNAAGNPATYTVENEITLADPTKAGYTFQSWTPSGKIAKGTTGNLSFKAVWEANPADVDIDPDGGTITPNDDVDKDGKIADDKKVGDTIKVPEIEKPGYTLKNWEDENGNPLQPGDEYTVPTGKGSLKPVWEANPADVTVDPDGGTITPNDDVDKEGKIADGKKVGDTIKVPEIEKPGYTLKNWEDENGNPLQPGDEYTVPTGKGSLKAVWEANPADVTVDPDGGTITPNNDVDKDGKIADDKKVGETIKVPEIEKPGYTLKNWEDENGNPLQPGDEYTVPAGKGSLKAVWEANPADVDIDPDGGTITPNDDVDKDGKVADSKKVGDTIKVPEIEKPGYTLKNWEDENGNQLQPGDEYTVPAGKGSLKAVWEANPADVTVDPDGGTITPNGDVDKDGKIADDKKVGDTIKVPEIEKPGYTLKNWEDENGNPLQPGDEYTVPTGKGTLKPVWEANPADVDIDPDGGTITPNTDVDKDGKIADDKKVGDTIKVPEIEKPGYTLKNWEDENGNPLQPGDEYTVPAGKGSLKAVWEANPADVDIDPDGGTITPNGDVDKDGKIADGKKVGDTIEVPDIEKPGYTLKNWEDENGNPLQPGDEYIVPTGKGNLKPVWEVVTYNITYDLGGGTNAADNPATYTVEDEITLADPTRTGYTFQSWTPDGKITKGTTGDLTFTASWKAKDAVIDLDAAGGTITPNDDVDKDGNPIDKKVGDTLVLPEAEKPGYAFQGWSDGTTTKQAGENYEIPDQKVTLVATWKAVEYTITYDLAGGTNAAANPATYTVEDEITLADPTKTGYTFQSWTPNGKIAKGTTGDLTFTAVWEGNPADVAIDPDGGTITPNDDVDKDGKIADDKKVGDTIEVPDIEKPGYTLKNWEDENGNPLQPGDEYTIPAEGGSLKPVWEANPADVDIDPDGGTITPNDDVDKDGKIADGKKVGDTIKVPDIEKPGYTLKNWEDENGNPLQPGDEYMVPTGKGSLKAAWEANPADVTIDPDGGTITPNDDVDKDGKIADGKKVGDTIKVPEIEKPGYTLKNWEDENGNPLQPGDEYTVPTGKGSLKPVWEANLYTVTWLDSDGKTLKAESVAYGTTPVYEGAEPTKTDPTNQYTYTFSGWEPAVSPVIGDVAYTAQFDQTQTGFHIFVKDYTNGGATTSIDESVYYSGDVSFTVDAERAAVVAVHADATAETADDQNGSYQRLQCAEANGTHTFTVTVSDADVYLVVGYKGDATLDGTVDLKDATRTSQVYTETQTLNALQTLLADVVVDEILDLKDSTRISQDYVMTYTIPWDIQE